MLHVTHDQRSDCVNLEIHGDMMRSVRIFHLPDQMLGARFSLYESMTCVTCKSTTVSGRDEELLLAYISCHDKLSPCAV